MRPLDFDSDVPVYEQIKQQLTFGIARGTYEAGDKLPSVRSLAKRLLVNPNTILRVYRELEQAGLVRTWRGKGVFVTSEAPERCEDAAPEAVGKALREAVVLAQQAGLSERVLDDLYRRVLDEVKQEQSS